MGAYTPIGQGSGVWHGHTDEMERNGRHQGEADSRSSNSPCLAWPAPKVLMQSGIGDQTTLQRLGIPVLQHLPGVGENFQDHLAFDCVWEYQEALSPRNNMSEAIFFWGSKSGLHSPDLFASQAEVDIRECSKISSARCRVDTARGRRPPKKPRASTPDRWGLDKAPTPPRPDLRKIEPTSQDHPSAKLHSKLETRTPLAWRR